ncbi:MAG: TolC family protein, partial [Lentisphaerae bacterium]|nr:TolC family protein [Lentisphaerota bacterium]
RTAFYDLLLARETVGVREASLAQLESLLTQTESRFRQGVAAEYDVLTARVRAANERPAVIRARNTRDVAREAFKRLLNLDDEAFEIEGALRFEPVEADIAAWQTQALEERPALRMMRTQVALAEEDMRAARSGQRPEVRAEFAYDGANPYGFASVEEEWEWHWTAGLVLHWPLWDGGLTRGVVREKELVLAKTRTDLGDLRRAIRLEVTEAALDLRRAAEAVDAGRGTVGLAEKGLEIAASRYEEGLATYLEYTDANVALRTARLSYLQALRDHLEAKARVAYALGAPDVVPAGAPAGADADNGMEGGEAK